MQPIEIPAFNPELVWTIVPVKPLTEAKSRLASILTTSERASLAFNLLKHTLEVLQELVNTKKLAGTLVVSADPFILNEAEKFSALALLQARGSSDAKDNEALNRDLRVATNWAVTQLKADRLLILPADLPWLTPIDISELLSLEYEAVLAPDRAQRGTNALLLPAQIAQSFVYSFGETSFNLHREQLSRWGVSYQVIYRDNLAFDLDEEEDLAQLTLALKKALLAK